MDQLRPSGLPMFSVIAGLSRKPPASTATALFVVGWVVRLGDRNLGLSSVMSLYVVIVGSSSCDGDLYPSCDLASSKSSSSVVSFSS